MVAVNKNVHIKRNLTKHRLYIKVDIVSLPELARLLVFDGDVSLFRHDKQDIAVAFTSNKTAADI